MSAPDRDLVERLRFWRDDLRAQWLVKDLLTDAADEIERLRAMVATRERMLAKASDTIVCLRQQIAGHCERIAAQSEALTRRAERRPCAGDDDWCEPRRPGER